MFEAIITIVRLETQDNITYPVTKIYRVQYDSERGVETWLRECVIDPENPAYHIAHSEKLHAS